MHQLTRLENGITVATAEMPHMASVSVGIWVAVGGRFEPAEISGVSHFIEHLLFKGTQKRSAREISQAVEGIGGYLNAFTSEESTCFYSKARHDRFDELLEVLTDMFLHSRFDLVDVDKERSVIKEELAMYRDQPQHHVHDLLNELMWPDQPLGRSLTGSEKTLDAIQRPSLLSFRNANYVAPGILVIAAGNLQHRKVVRAVRSISRRFPSGKRPTFLPARDGQQAPRVKLVTRKTEQTQLAIGLRTCSRHDERRFALRLLSTMLGENMSSRLFQSVREDHGLAYSIFSSNSYFDDVGGLVISAGLDPDKLPQAIKLILRELRRCVDDLPSVTELRRARDYTVGQMDLGLESTENQMMWLGEHLLGYGRMMEPAEMKRRLAAVRPAEIRAVAREFFRPERMSVALISPLKETSWLPRLLRI